MPAFADMPLSLLVLVLGTVNVIVCWKVARTRVWPVLLYWLGWTAGIYAAEALSGDGIMPVFTDTNRQLLLRLHVAAAFGFFLACVVFHVGRGAVAKTQRHDAHGDTGWQLLIHPRFVTVAFLIQLSLGILLLVARLQLLGSISYSGLLESIRDSYVRSAGLGASLPPMVRLGSHAANFLMLFPFFFGLQDGLDRRTRFGRVLLWWLCSIPGGISTGGRGWIITTPLVYLVSYLVASTDRFNLRLIRRWTVRVSASVVVLAVLFAAVEKGRRTNDVLSGLTAARWYQKAPIGKAVVYYLGLPILGVDAYTEYARREEPYNGALTFGFFAAQWERLNGATNRSASEFNVASRSAMFFGPYPILFATHVPVIPNLVADFGLRAFPYVFATICFVTVLGYLLLSERGLVARFIAVTIGIGLFWSCQSLMLGDAGMVLPIVWLFLMLRLDGLLRGVRVHTRPWLAMRQVVLQP